MCQYFSKSEDQCSQTMKHVYIKKALMEEFFTNVTVENIYFSDHDALGIAIQNIYINIYMLIFILIHKICYNQVRKKKLNCSS